MNAKASLDYAEAEFNRIQSLLDQKVVSQSEYDQRRTQVEAARQQYQVALNSAQQSYRSLEAARARIIVARKAVADTERPGAVLRPGRRACRQRRRLRHARRARRDGRPGRPAAAGADRPRTVGLAGQARVCRSRWRSMRIPARRSRRNVRFVSPSLRAEQRALTVEAVAANADGRLKPGMFATARIHQPAGAPALLVPADARLKPSPAPAASMW